MASKQSDAVKQHWIESAELGRRGASLEEIRLSADRWSNLTAEPGKVDYAEVEANGVPALWVEPRGCATDRVILCLHGGGYVSGSMYSHRKLYAHLAKAVGCRALVPEYRLTPEHPFPAQLEDVMKVYGWLLEEGIAPERIALAGDSAGAGLAIGCQIRARELNLPQASAIMTISAWTDLELSGPSYDANRAKDPLFQREMVGGLVAMLLGPEGDRRNPYVSPLHADLRGLPPVYLQVGGDEGLLDDSVSLAEQAARCGVEAKLDVFPEMLHSFQMGAGRVPEADDAIARFAGWVRPRLGLPA